MLYFLDRSFYVGDAAGRKDDHSDADKKFAEVIINQYIILTLSSLIIAMYFR